MSNTPNTPTHFALPIDHAEALARYLMQRPMIEVEPLVNMLRSMQPIDAAPPVAKDG